MARYNSFRIIVANTMALAWVVVSQTPITSCPSQVRTYSGASGASYAVCASSDYRGPSDQVLQDVGSIKACIQMCDAAGGQCARAVYDNQGAICHIKSNQPGDLTWVEDTKFSTIVRTTTMAGPGSGSSGAALTQCPSGDRPFNTFTGAQFLICANTDFRGESASVTPASSTESCAELCSGTAGCTNAVFDKVDSQCHVKGDPSATALTWVMDQRFDVMRLNVGAQGGGFPFGGVGTGSTGGEFVPPASTDPGLDPALAGFLGGLIRPPPPPPPPQGPPPGFFGFPFVKRGDPEASGAKSSRVARFFKA